MASSLPGLVMSRSESRDEASASAEKDGDDGSGSAAVPGGTVENDAGGTTLCFDGETSTSSEDEEGQTIQVHVETSPEAFPEGTTMTVAAVTDPSVLDTISDGVAGKVASVSAVSVTFNAPDGGDVKPADTLNVTMSADSVTAEQDALSVVQYTGEGVEQSEADDLSAAAESVQELDPLSDPNLAAEPETEIDPDYSVTIETSNPSVLAIVEKAQDADGSHTDP